MQPRVRRCRTARAACFGGWRRRTCLVRREFFCKRGGRSRRRCLHLHHGRRRAGRRLGGPLGVPLRGSKRALRNRWTRRGRRRAGGALRLVAWRCHRRCRRCFGATLGWRFALHVNRDADRQNPDRDGDGGGGWTPTEPASSGESALGAAGSGDWIAISALGGGAQHRGPHLGRRTLVKQLVCSAQPRGLDGVEILCRGHWSFRHGCIVVRSLAQA